MRDLTKLEEKVATLESIVEELKNPVIGVVWCDTTWLSYNSTHCLYSVVDGIDLDRFEYFTKKDITDNINGYIKIRSTWFSIKDVVFYDDVYNKQKDVIKKRKAKKKGK